MKVSFTFIYHPQSNGAVEHANGLIFEANKKILEGEKKGNWAEVLPRAVWATTQPFVQPPTSPHSSYCSELRQHYQKK
jgi:hypothetical protein